MASGHLDKGCVAEGEGEGGEQVEDSLQYFKDNVIFLTVTEEKAVVEVRLREDQLEDDRHKYERESSLVG